LFIWTIFVTVATVFVVVVIAAVFYFGNICYKNWCLHSLILILSWVLKDLLKYLFNPEILAKMQKLAPSVAQIKWICFVSAIFPYLPWRKCFWFFKIFCLQHYFCKEEKSQVLDVYLYLLCDLKIVSFASR